MSTNPLHKSRAASASAYILTHRGSFRSGSLRMTDQLIAVRRSSTIRRYPASPTAQIPATLSRRNSGLHSRISETVTTLTGSRDAYLSELTRDVHPLATSSSSRIRAPQAISRVLKLGKSSESELRLLPGAQLSVGHPPPSEPGIQIRMISEAR